MDFLRSLSIKFSLIGRSRYYKTNCHHQPEKEEANSTDGADITDSNEKNADVSNNSNQNGSRATTSEEVDHISKATEVYNRSKKEVCERHQELISHYCMPLVKVEFAGQSNSTKVTFLFCLFK